MVGKRREARVRPARFGHAALAQHDHSRTEIGPWRASQLRHDLACTRRAHHQREAGPHHVVEPPFAAILRDIEDGKLSRQRAAADYALAFTPAGDIDEAATATLRAARRT